jgi:hypothetical protein
MRWSMQHRVRQASRQKSGISLCAQPDSLRARGALPAASAALRETALSDGFRIEASEESLSGWLPGAGPAWARRDLPCEAIGGLDQLVASPGTQIDAGQLRGAVAPDSLAARQERAWRARRHNLRRTPDDGGCSRPAWTRSDVRRC